MTAMVSILWVSLKVALLTTVLVMLSSLALGLFLAGSRSKIAKVIELFIYLPMAMPPIALGYGLLILLGPNSSFGFWLLENFKLRIAFTFLGAIIATFMVSLGIGVRAMRLALEQIGDHHGHIAELMGASKIQVFLHITLPLCRPALVGAAALVFLRSLGEFGATLILAGNSLGNTRTLALAIWTTMQTPGQEKQALILVLVAVVVSILALLASEYYLRRFEGK